MDLKQFTVMASGKMRQCAYDALKDKVNLLSWQQGGRMPQEQFDAWLSQADAIFSISNFKAVGQSAQAQGYCPICCGL